MLDRAALRARVCGEAEPEGPVLSPTVVSDRTAMAHSADRHNKTTSRPTRNTHSGSAAPRTAGLMDTAPPFCLHQSTGAPSPPPDYY
ncbi:hypothetical protein PBY51_017901 [Eleginops maclovinus]|uniref:Uncharacterized protein n=1 Tax=Eleginops maclovinus TaxID=56733 RepID=A0AAN8AJR0_ELEMC|nr:hypothetical protein PBY51_017901 [Eleginops maclovinus]